MDSVGSVVVSIAIKDHELYSWGSVHDHLQRWSSDHVMLDIDRGLPKK